jgi:hypothetical protein
MTNQARFTPGAMPEIAAPGGDTSRRWLRILLRTDAALRLGPRPVALWLAHRAACAMGLPGRRLADRAVPDGPFLPASASAAPPLPPEAAAELLRAVAALPGAPDWHGRFPAGAAALSIPLHRGPGARVAWEASRLAALPLLAQAARLDPAGGHLARAEALLAGWCAANPPFRGVNWACGQEAALRALHLALALALLDADHDPPPGARALLALSAARIAATPLYAAAQDNNHAVSEAAGAYACALLLGRPVAGHAAALAARVARLVAPDGGFAQLSPGYARLLLDTLGRRRMAAPAAWRGALPGAGRCPRRRLRRLAARGDGARHGRHSRRSGWRTGQPSPTSRCAVRAIRAAASSARCASSPGGRRCADDPGCAWLGLGRAARRALPSRWRVAGLAGRAEAGALGAAAHRSRCGFRPGQCDLLHLSLRDGAEWVDPRRRHRQLRPARGLVVGRALRCRRAQRRRLRRGGSDAPRGPLPARPLAAPAGSAGRRRGARRARQPPGTAPARRGPQLDGGGRALRPLPPRRAALAACGLASWRLAGDGVEGPAARISVTADAPLRLALVQGWESPGYGRIAPVPGAARWRPEAPVRRIATRIALPEGGPPCPPRS